MSDASAPGSLAALDALLARAGGGLRRVLVLTGAGVSAESGVPTFRGREGHWSVGSREYQPMELATRAAFLRDPEASWSWYLHRRATCLAARPNAAHEAITAIERRLRAEGDDSRFTLITQNVDGLHVRAGSSMERTWCIHGDLELMRCAAGCTPRRRPRPADLPTPWPRGRALRPEEAALLRCEDCGGRARPHVLWFDECYDEELYRWDSSIRAALACDVLVVVGTAGQTNLPLRVAAFAARRGVPLVVLNREESPFTELAREAGRGVALLGRATELVPAVLDRVARAAGV